MRIVTWNVNSLKAREDFVGHYLDEEAPDVLCLQELKMETEKVPTELFESRGYYLAIHGQKSWNGVLIAAKSPLTDVHRGLPADEGQARAIAASVDGIRLVNLYCPQGQAADSPKFTYKLAFYDSLCEWLGGSDLSEPWVVLGDLNVAPRPEDVWSVEEMAGIPSYHPEEHERWARLLELGLHDEVAPRVAPGTFTYWDYRFGAFHRNIGMRIDHILLSEPLRSRVASAFVGREWRKKKHGLTASDHAPVHLDLD
ncbi:MAG: exodeoxyribonuclease III [Acidobacteriota bacterium]